MSNFKSVLAQIKAEYNIVDLVQEENVQLQASGPGVWKGLCPFHSEKTPSFNVSESFQNYKCFGCGASGDIFSFIQETHGCSFMDAVKYLADQKGIKIDFNKSDSDKPKVDLTSLYALVKDAYEFYRDEFNKLDNNHPAKKNILDRGLPLDDPIYGYAPESYGALYKYLKNKGYAEDLMLQSQLIIEKNNKYYDFFFGRLMITLSDFAGRPVSFSARKLFDTDTRAKYVNGKESPIYKKKSLLFNLANAKRDIRDKKEIILTEGPFDVLALVNSGITNVVASCGTAFTEEHLKIAHQLVGVDGKLIFSFDGDTAGIKAALRLFVNFPITHTISSVVLFPNNEDPGDCFKKRGAKGIQEVMSHRTQIVDFIINQITRTIKLTDMNSRYTFARIAVGKFAVVMNDEVLRDYFLRKVSLMSGLELTKIEDLYKSFKADKNAHHVVQDIKQAANNNNEQIELNQLDDSDKCIVSALSLLIRHPFELVHYTETKKIPPKFIPFLRELSTNMRKYKTNGTHFRFIPEEYSDTEFAKSLQNFNTLTVIEKPSEDDMIAHYRYLINVGHNFYKNQQKNTRKAAILGAMNQAKSNKELYEMLNVLKKEGLIK